MGPTTGGYTIQVTAQSAIGAGGNNSPGTAQNMTSSFLSLGGNASRGAVLGASKSVLAGMGSSQAISAGSHG